MIGVIAVIAAIAIFASGLFGDSKMVTVPNVINYTKDEAEKTLEAAGFEVEYGTPVTDEEVEEGNVVDQTPDGNREAKEGSTVKLISPRDPSPSSRSRCPTSPT